MFTSTTSLNPSSNSSSYVDFSPYIYHHHHEPAADHQSNNFLLQNQIQNENPLSILPLIDNHSKHHHEVIQATGDYFVHQFGLHNNGGTTSNSVVAKRAPKKDRHSKIYTAQGLRDRRVRMSIEIARKFFDLQDLLGFDKASKTLEWLLKKSKKAIKKLAHQSGDHNSTTLNYNNNNSSNSTCEEAEAEAEEEEEEKEEENVISKKTKKKKGAVVALSSMQITAKQLREKARARARERTRIKLLSNNNAKFNDSYMMNLYHHHHNPYSFYSPCNYDQNSSSSSKIVGGEVVPYGSISTIGESILIKRKSMMGYQQNLFLMKDFSNCNNFPNLPPNWDNNNDATARSSSYCAITSMNSSTGAHLHGKFSEADQSSKWL